VIQQQKIDNVSLQAQRVIDTLTAGGHAAAASDLLQLINKLNAAQSDPEKIDILVEIQKRCHVRWLGDLFIDGISMDTWWKELDKLRKFSRV